MRRTLAAWPANAGMTTAGAAPVSVRCAAAGITSTALVAVTTGAKVVRLSDRAEGTTTRGTLTTGADAVNASAAATGATTRGADTTGVLPATASCAAAGTTSRG